MAMAYRNGNFATVKEPHRKARKLERKNDWAEEG
jgi:hypothetical protein